MTATTAASSITDWIRPWYVGAVLTHPQLGGHIEGHIYPDCERLLRIESQPREGSGWLDPHTGYVCASCTDRRTSSLRPATPRLSGATATSNVTVESAA
ncbi:hypothetical protein ACIBG4_40525 [Nonomuraea sp. NPDC050383]|uniref:hypothetical protein n=1 Tax=Nonomuraea sp. NPDC050383 TaxID=3364362 RepID=UPI00378A393C